MTIRTAYIETSDIKLASALLALGIPFSDETPFVKLKRDNGSEQWKFFFQEISNCGKFKTQEMIAAWYNDEFHNNNPEHPFSYIKCAFNNKDGLLDKIKQSVELVVIERNGKIAIISSNASEKLQNEIFSIL